MLWPASVWDLCSLLSRDDLTFDALFASVISNLLILGKNRKQRFIHKIVIKRRRWMKVLMTQALTIV